MNKRSAAFPDSLVRKYGTRDPFQIARMAGITVKFINTNRQKGFCRIILNNAFIFLSRNMSEEMQKMTCAHELGHLYLHRDILTKQAFLMEYELFDIRNDTELEANVFAARLLIDESELLELLDTEADMVAIASALHVNVNLLMIRLIEMQKRGYTFTIPFTPDRKFLRKIKDRAGSI